MTPQRLVDARRAIYGDPAENLNRTAKLWATLLGIQITAEQVALCQVAVKLSRLCETPGHGDSLDDIVGYADAAREMAG